MIHYTCDRCKRSIDPETEARYVVEIDVRLAGELEPVSETAEDVDHLAELHDQLQRETGRPGSDVDVADASSMMDQVSIPAVIYEDCDDGPDQFDLCADCHEIFSNNPLGRELSLGLGFSNN